MPALTLGACVSAVGAAYDDEPALPEGWAAVDRLDDGPVQATLAEVGGLRVLLLPGTNQLLDLARADQRPGRLLDLDSRPVRYGSYTAHAGAARYASRLTRWALPPGVPGAARLAIGHSLGGAAGLLLAGSALAVLAVAPFAPYQGAAPGVPALSLVDPRDAVPYLPGPLWHRPGATVTLPPSRGTVLEAHGCGSYRAQLGGLAALDLTPWLEESAG